MADITWTDEAVTTMFAMYAEGASCAVIAARIGKTRNAVIGKLRRVQESRGRWVRPAYGAPTIRLPRQPSQAKPEPLPPKPKPPLRKAPARPEIPAVTAVAVAEVMVAAPIAPPPPARPHGPPCGIVEVTGCRWPIAERPDLVGGHLFCNARCDENRSYCSDHISAAEGRAAVPFEPSDDDMIRSFWRDGVGCDWLAMTLKRTKQSIRSRASRLRLRTVA